MGRDAIRDSLVDLGIVPEDYRVLLALPLVYVAWADGEVGSVQAEFATRIVREQLGVREGAETLASWLRRRPSDDYFVRGLSLLRRMAALVDETHIGPPELQRLVVQAEDVARAGDSTVGGPRSVSAAERAALEALSRMLGVDGGEPWSEVLSELEGERPAEHVEPAAPAASSGRPEKGGDPVEEGERTGLRRYRTLARQSKKERPEPKGGIV